MISTFLKLIFLLVIAYIIYNVFKGITYLNNLKNNIGKKNNVEEKLKKSSSEQDNVIELDKDQYKVE